MAGITLEIANAQLTLWLTASSDVATRGQSYSIAGRSLSRADIAEINRQIDYWQGHINRLSAAATGRGRVRYGVPE